MKLEEFEMERWQSTWENEVRRNLSESGVEPVRIDEITGDDESELLSLPLGYGHTRGTPELRELIAGFHPGATAENVLVTSGTAEANFIASLLLADPGDEAAVMLPNYMQVWGLLRSTGVSVNPFWLTEEFDWSPNLDELESLVTSRTRLIAICNPNNPTGAILSDVELDRIVAIADRVGAWILSDEVYRGAERNGVETKTLWGMYDRVVVTGGLSKAYGLPGLRIGWLCSGGDVIDRAWSYHDYTTIAPAAASDLLARLALRNDGRTRLLGRTRAILNRNFPMIREFVDRQGDLLSLVEPLAGAIALVRYDLDIDSRDLAERLRVEKSVLVVPGAHFQMGRYFRLGYGGEAEGVRAGLGGISDLLSDLRISHG